MGIIFNAATPFSTFGDLFSDSDVNTTWYQLWTGDATGTNGNWVDTSVFNDNGNKEADGLVKKKYLLNIEADFAQADDTHLWVRTWNEDDGYGAWEIGAVEFNAITQGSIPLDSSSTAVDGVTVTENVEGDTALNEMFNVENAGPDTWLRIWIENESGTGGSYLDTEYGEGWVKVSDYGNERFIAAEVGLSREIWVTTWSSDTGYSGWEHWIVSTEQSGGAFDEIFYLHGDETVNAGDGNDFIKADSKGNIVYAGDGNDTILFDENNSIIAGGAGSDTLKLVDDGTFRAVTIDLEPGAQRFTGAISNDSISSIENVDASVETNHFWIFKGNNVSNTFIGGSAADYFWGKGGNDTFTGGSGDDTFNIDAGSDTITDLGNGDDVLIVSDNNVSVNASVTGDWTAGRDTANNNGIVFLNVNNSFDVDMSNAVVNTAAEDGYTINASGNIIVSVLVGSDADDTIFAGDGDDILTGNGGADIIIGNAGNDTFEYSDNDSFVNNTAVSGSNYDTVDVTLGDNFGWIANIAAAIANKVVEGSAVDVIGSDLLMSLNAAFQAYDDGVANIEACVIEYIEGEQFLCIDTDSSQTITDVDTVIELTGTVTGLALTAGHVQII